MSGFIYQQAVGGGLERKVRNEPNIHARMGEGVTDPNEREINH